MKLSEQMRGTVARKIRPPAIWSILDEYADKVAQLEAESEGWRQADNQKAVFLYKKRYADEFDEWLDALEDE